MGSILNMSKLRSIHQTARTAREVGHAVNPSRERLKYQVRSRWAGVRRSQRPGGDAPQGAPGRGGGSTWRHHPAAKARFDSPRLNLTAGQCMAKFVQQHDRKDARYSATFQPKDVYRRFRALISKTAMTNHDQCRNTSIPEKRNSRTELCWERATGQSYSTSHARRRCFR